MDIALKRSTDFVGEDRSWLASADGTENLKSIVLALPLFTKSTHYPDGVIKSGTHLGRCTSGTHSGKYGPYSDAATDGRQVFVGVLFNSTPVRVDALAPTYVGAPMQRWGVIDESRLPANSGVDAAAKADLKGSFTYE